jgi:hypothetical protein
LATWLRNTSPGIGRGREREHEQMQSRQILGVGNVLPRVVVRGEQQEQHGEQRAGDAIAPAHDRCAPAGNGEDERTLHEPHRKRLFQPAEQANGLEPSGRQARDVEEVRRSNDEEHRGEQPDENAQCRETTGRRGLHEPCIETVKGPSHRRGHRVSAGAASSSQRA